MIEPILNAVFEPVSDMQRSIEWYSRLLNLPVTATSHEGLIHELPLPSETGIMLDAHGEATHQSCRRQSHC